MDTRELILTEDARQDLRGIYEHIAEESPDAAAEFTEDLTRKIHWIAEVGFNGLNRDWVREGLRIFPYRDRNIFFIIEGNRTIIMRVLGGSMDVSDALFNFNQDE
ncbi:MAG: type II toxin-antitoxin system RelE/ParE family toxin [Rhizobiales bacterium]|nr:type II toxin-antitoxin system RelE/ParE family toxin [Hyphomicrobiales bacterium]